jgi:hypothetical protein
VLSDRLRGLPYLVHTNRELGLMLARKKPLSYFVDGKEFFPDSVVRYLRLFDRQVAAGRLIRHDHFSDAPWALCKTYHHILFALPDETWRIQAMLDLVFNHSQWTAELERKQGELLGYERWMTDYWIKHIFGK